MNLDDLFQKSRIPEPPADLRARVLKQKYGKIENRVSISERIFESRVLRLAWTMCVVFLLLFLLRGNTKLPAVNQAPGTNQMLKQELEPGLHTAFGEKNKPSWDLPVETETLMREIS